MQHISMAVCLPESRQTLQTNTSSLSCAAGLVWLLLIESKEFGTTPFRGVFSMISVSAVDAMTIVSQVINCSFVVPNGSFDIRYHLSFEL